MIDFSKLTTTREECETIFAIVKRALPYGIGRDRLTLAMDIEACHGGVCPLRLGDLLKADDINFWHDVSGIVDHLDRHTGHLKDCFVPRFAR